MKLHSLSYGEGAPLVILHGLFGSARNWNAIAKRMAQHRHVVAVDLRNHGQSPWADTHSYQDLADDLAETLSDLAPFDLLGHSMGGKAAMMLALTRPESLHRLIVADIAPIAYSHSHLNYIEAMQAVDLDKVARRADADAQLAQHIDEPALRAFFLQSLELTEAGARWMLNLETLGQQMERIIGFDPVEAVFDGPTLFLRGGRSDYVLPEHHQDIFRLFPNASIETLEGAGHWLHAEAPRPFIAALDEFLR